MIDIQRQLSEHVRKALKNIGISDISAEVGAAQTGPGMDHPKDISHGDYSTNAALVYSKIFKLKPADLARKIAAELEKDSELSEKSLVAKIETAGPGFINFHLKPEFFRRSIADIAATAYTRVAFGSNDYFAQKGIQKVIVEYTDPNPFKEFHIGHLMSNAIGESISRIVAFSGAEVKRACYQGDTGLHVAKAIWAYLYAERQDGKNAEKKDGKNAKKDDGDFGKYYVVGSAAYEENETAKKEIIAVNKKIYSKEDPEINAIYEKGRKASLEGFDAIYEKLGTKFDFFFFESETGGAGKRLVEQGLAKGVFEKSDGAIVYKGDENLGLHTRVFINSEDLPTYEAKELGLVEYKYKKYPYDLSVVVTGNEIRDYFKVLLDAVDKTFSEGKNAKKIKNIKHIPHGMLRLPSGKMSSRKGGVITAESLIAEVSKLISEKVKDGATEASETVAIGAIKYSILRQGSDDDIIFDFGKSISFEGDSGPYLQYSTVRAKSIREKAAGEGIAAHVGAAKNEKSENKNPAAYPAEISTLEKLLYRFPEIVERSAEEYEPHYITTYLVELAAAFNNYYAKNQIVLKSDPASPYKVALTQAFEIVMRNGLNLLGIGVPERM